MRYAPVWSFLSHTQQRIPGACYKDPTQNQIYSLTSNTWNYPVVNAFRSARVDPIDNLVRRRIYDGDLAGIVLRDIEPRLRRIERHSERVPIELDALDQMPGLRR